MRSAVDLSVLPFGGTDTTGLSDGFLSAFAVQNLSHWPPDRPYLSIRFSGFGLDLAAGRRKNLQPPADRAEVSAYSSICRQGHPRQLRWD